MAMKFPDFVRFAGDRLRNTGKRRGETGGEGRTDYLSSTQVAGRWPRLIRSVRPQIKPPKFPGYLPWLNDQRRLLVSHDYHEHLFLGFDQLARRMTVL